VGADGAALQGLPAGQHDRPVRGGDHRADHHAGARGSEGTSARHDAGSVARQCRTSALRRDGRGCSCPSPRPAIMRSAFPYARLGWRTYPGWSVTGRLADRYSVLDLRQFLTASGGLQSVRLKAFLARTSSACSNQSEVRRSFKRSRAKSRNTRTFDASGPPACSR
jgi:hypothetical protein